MSFFPSTINVGSFVQYSVRGTNQASRRSQSFVSAFKYDQPYFFRNSGPALEDRTRPSIKTVAQIIKRKLDDYEMLQRYFGRQAILIPAPGHAPKRGVDQLDVPLRICQELVDVGLASGILPCVVRTVKVNQSSKSHQTGKPRVMPPEHYQTTDLIKSIPLVAENAKFVVIDDVVTRGSTFVGITPHLRKAFPHHQINYFAVCRTISLGDIDDVVAPDEEVVRYDGPGYSLKRSKAL